MNPSPYDSEHEILCKHIKVNMDITTLHVIIIKQVGLSTESKIMGAWKRCRNTGVITVITLHASGMSVGINRVFCLQMLVRDFLPHFLSFEVHPF